MGTGIFAHNVQVDVPEHTRPVTIDVYVKAAWVQRVDIFVDGEALPPPPGLPYIYGNNGDPAPKKIYHHTVPAGDHRYMVTVSHSKNGSSFDSNGDLEIRKMPNQIRLSTYDRWSTTHETVYHEHVNCEVVFSW